MRKKKMITQIFFQCYETKQKKNGGGIFQSEVTCHNQGVSI